MKKLTKIFVLLLTLVITSVLVSCGDKTDYKAMLDNFLLTQDGTTVSESFELDSVLDYKGTEYKLTWTSSSEYVKLAISEVNGNYVASISYPETRTDVTLTVKLGNATKNFTVTVAPMDVYTFLSSYAFAKNKATVTDNFELDKEYEVAGKKATIAWSVADAYADYLEIGTYTNAKGEEVYGCKVTQSTLNPEVKIKATFTYNGESASKEYRMTVSAPKSHVETVDGWYTVAGTSIDIEGYVVAIGAAYSSQYKNVSVYIVDKDFDCGYYCYRASATVEEGAQVEVGSYVKVSAAVSYFYNGLVESSATGTLVVDETVTKLDPTKCAQYYYAIDNDIFAASPATVYNESRMVSLTNWQVKAIDTTDNTKLVTITKNGNDVNLYISKYYEGAYTLSDDNAVVQAIKAKIGTLAVGDYVSVTGLFGQYKGTWQILLGSADEITKTQADAADTTYPAVTAKAVIAENTTEINKVNNKLMVSNKEFTLLTEKNGVTVTYELMSTSKSIAINGGTFTITPVSVEERVNVKVTYTIGEYSTFDIFTLNTIKKSDAQMAEEEAKEYNYRVEDATAGLVELLNTPETYEGVTFTFAVDEEYASLVKVIDGNKVFLSAVAEATEVVIKVTAHSGEATYTADAKFNILPAEFITFEAVKAPTADGDYYAAFNNGSYLFLTGEMSGYYGATTTNYTEGVKAGIEAVEGGYNLYVTVKGAKQYINAVASGDYVNFKYETTASSVWVINENGQFTTTLGSETIWVGGRGTYTTGGVYKNSQYSMTASGNYPLTLVKVAVDDTDMQGRADAAANAFKNVTVAESVTEGTLANISSKYSDVYLTYALKEASDALTLDGYTWTATHGSADVAVVVVVTATCGDKTATKEITYTVSSLAVEKTIAEILTAAAELENKAYLTGTYITTGVVTVVSETTANYVKCTISNGVQSIDCYKLVGDGFADVTVGDIITVKGAVQKYGTAIQFTSSPKLMSKTDATAMTIGDIYAAGLEAGSGNNINESKVVSTYGVVTSLVSSNKTVESVKYYTLSFWMADANGKIEAYNYYYGTESTQKVAVGDTVVVCGVVKNYNGTVEFNGTTLVSVVKGDGKISDAAAIWFVKEQINAVAAKKIEADYTLPTTYTVENYAGTITVAWKDAADAALTTIAYTSPETDTEVATTATVTCGEATSTYAVKWTLSDKYHKTIYVTTTAASSTELTDGDVTAQMAKGYSGYITVTVAKNEAGTAPTLATGNFRLYKATTGTKTNGGSAVFTAATGYEITKIEINYNVGSSSGNTAKLVVTPATGNVVNGNATKATTITLTNCGSSVTLANAIGAGSGNTVYIASITVTVAKTAA